MLMKPIKFPSSLACPVPRCRPDLAGLVASTLAGAVAALQGVPTSALRRQCLGVVEQLWLRRDAVTRALSMASASAPWPPTAQACADGLRWVVERATDDPALRLVLVQLGSQLLTPRLAELQKPPAATLIEQAQPGEWFRMFLHDEWAMARLTWRSDNGRYFMFSSRPAGRSHSLSRGALERMIAGGLLERLSRSRAAAAAHRASRGA